MMNVHLLTTGGSLFIKNSFTPWTRIAAQRGKRTSE